MLTINSASRRRTNSTNRTAKWLLVGIILLALLLRAWGVSYGLPYIFRADEANYVTRAQNIFKTGDLNPHLFNYPSFLFYVNALAYVPYYLVGKLIGAFQSPADVSAPVRVTTAVGYSPLPSTLLLGRGVSVVFGTVAVVVIFLAGQQLTKSAVVGLLAALMMAISPSIVQRSRAIKPDIFVAFFALLTFLGAVKVFQEGKTSHYIMAGIASGLAASCKYNGALAVVSLISAHFLRCGWNGFKDRRLYFAIALSAIMFMLVTPFALLDWPEFIDDVQFEARHYTTGHAGMEGNTLIWYLTFLWQSEGPVAVLAVVEVLRGIYKLSKQTILLSTFPLLYFVFINRFTVRNLQTILPLIPFLFLLASSLMVDLFTKAKRLWPNVRQPLVLAIGISVIVSLAPPLQKTVRETARLSEVDSRQTASAWIAENLPKGARIALEARGPYADPQQFSVEPCDMTAHTPDWYAAHGFDYVVLSELTWRLYYREPDRYSKAITCYEELFDAFDLVKKFTGGGYEIRIYAVTDR